MSRGGHRAMHVRIWPRAFLQVLRLWVLGQDFALLWGGVGGLGGGGRGGG